MTYKDWADKEDEVMQDDDLRFSFENSEDYREAFLDWHRKIAPENWGND